MSYDREYKGCRILQNGISLALIGYAEQENIRRFKAEAVCNVKEKANA